MMKKYQCIECGSKVERLYHNYNTDVIKIQHCDVCLSVADKYIEYEPTIIVLDALLLQPQAYRHLLINTPFNSHWKLALLIWLCDAFTKLILQRSEFNNQQLATNFEYISYTSLGMTLYLNYIIAAVELFIFIGSVFLIFSIKSFLDFKTFKLSRTTLITKAIIFASFGRLLALPALLWAHHSSYLYLVLRQGFVFLSTVQALRVVDSGHHSTTCAAVAVAIGFIAQALFLILVDSWFI